MTERQQIGKIWQRALTAAREGRVLRSGIPWLRQRGLPLPMSLQAYAFDRFKRERHKSIPSPDFSAVQWVGKPGLVSIVLPAYNGERYVEAALDSICSQTYSDWECIAVDDGSTDRTRTILDHYSRLDRRIHVVHQENRKLPGALKSGFSLAQGEFLTWTSVDNLLYPQFLERMVDCLQRHPGWDMVYANLDIIGEDGEPLRNSDWYRSYQVPLDSEHIHLPRDPAELNTRPDNYLGAAFLYRSRVAGLVGDYSPYRYTIEDYDYWMRVNALMELRHADFSEPVYAYRFHSRSLTSRDAELAITARRDRLLVFDAFRRDFYLSPLLWCVEAGSNPSATGSAASFRQMLSDFGHILFEAGSLEMCDLPHLWFPLSYIYFGGKTSELPSAPADLPPRALKILVSCTDEDEAVALRLPANDGWDLRVLLRSADRRTDLGPSSAYQIAVPDIGALLSALDVWARSRHLSSYDAEVANPRPGVRHASVVICTYKRPERLAAALKSISVQGFPAEDNEVVIVNNDPEGKGIRPLVDRWRGELFAGDEDRLRLVHCPVVGLSYARNAGISEAHGEVICFIDDDALAEPDWLQWIWSAFEDNHEAGVIGGKILLRKPDPAPGWMLPGWEIYWSHFDPQLSGFTTVRHWSQYPWGANWAGRRQSLLETGGFPARGFGRKEGKIQDGEEIAAAALVQKMGYEVGVEPRARVIHAVDPSRFTFRFVWAKIFRSRWRWYQSQVDLYLPAELGVRHAWRRIRLALVPFKATSLLKVPYVLLAEAMTTFWILRDWLKRMRTPVTLRRD